MLPNPERESIIAGSSPVEGHPASQDTILFEHYLHCLETGIQDQTTVDQFAVRAATIIDIHLAKMAPWRTDRADIRQDILARLFADNGRRFRRLSFQTGGGLNNWLASVVRNELIDLSRHSAEKLARKSSSLDRTADGHSTALVEQLASPSRQPGEAMDRETQRCLIASALASLLTNDEKSAISAWSTSGGSYDEVALTLGMTPTKVRMLIHRGVKKLRESLGKRSGIQ
jgi:RNA polymerase sigma factor (sigma-70 family)